MTPPSAHIRGTLAAHLLSSFADGRNEAVSDMSCEVVLGSIKACHRLAAIECNVRYEASLSGLSDELRQLPVADICQRQVWIPKPTTMRISIELNFDDEVFSTSTSWPTRAIVETLANSELWSQLQYNTSSEYTDPVAGDKVIRMVLSLHSTQNDHDTASISTRRASHRIYNRSMPQCTQAPLGVPACNLESVKIRCSFCRHTTRASNRNQTRRRFDSGIDLSKDDPADAGDIDMLDLFDDDSDEDLFDDDRHEDLFDDDRKVHSKNDTVNDLFDDYSSLAPETSRAEIAISAQAPDEEDGMLSIRRIVDILDAAVRTILCPRLTSPSPDVKVKKDKNLVRLDELAPAALKPQALRVSTFVHSLLTMSRAKPLPGFRASFRLLTHDKQHNEQEQFHQPRFSSNEI
ncbi:hypothetical protein BDZ85DRAFT_261784 [Elsinoe ampelina]|uniref:Uncharacterized protein n=1 Tax=Elsinoe ampelina TaxID=302913 RepID=A0A6A6GCU7_9PEZI|nr:hypothetical protein BDZ85DRAFT_261784 [Elsinoe ampelina]